MSIYRHYYISYVCITYVCHCNYVTKTTKRLSSQWLRWYIFIALHIITPLIYQLVKVLIDCLHATRFSKYNSNFNEISKKKKAFMYRDSIVSYLRDHVALLIIFFHYCITVLFVIMLYGKYVVLIEAPRSSRHNSVNQLATLSSLMWAVCCFRALRRSICLSAIGCIERNIPIQGICTLYKGICTYMILLN